MEILKKAGIIITKDKKIPAENVEKKIKRLKLSLDDIVDVKYLVSNSNDLQRSLSGMLNPDMKEKQETITRYPWEVLVNDCFAIKGKYNSVYVYSTLKEAQDACDREEIIYTMESIINEKYKKF